MGEQEHISYYEYYEVMETCCSRCCARRVVVGPAGERVNIEARRLGWWSQVDQLFPPT